MSTHRATPAGADPDRHLRRALAALREAAEHLGEAAAAGEHPSFAVASASSHVAAARAALRPHWAVAGAEGPEADAA